MPNFNQEIKRDMYRDLAAKQHLALRMARVPRAFACDATETETAEDYSKRMLEKLGMKAGSDPIANLTMFLTGNDSGAMSRMGGRAFAGMDSSDSSHIVDRYIRGEI